MNEELKFNADASYRLAEQKASQYFHLLSDQVLLKNHIPVLINDIEKWQQKHVFRNSLRSLISNRKRKEARKGYFSYIRWLHYTGKLENYLDRSISYIFLRDLGKTLDSSHTQLKIQKTLLNINNYLINSACKGKKDKTTDFSLAGLYRMAQKEKIETAMIWVINKLKTVSTHIPKEMEAEHAQRKLIKIIAGVLMHVIEEMDEDISAEERRLKMDAAIRLGYSYGLTYPFIDDLLDSNVLSDSEKKQFSNLLRNTLVTGTVPEIGVWSGNNSELIEYIHSELREAFECIKKHRPADSLKSFLEQSYVFFQSQEEDRLKDLANSNYTNEELYIPIILKSSSSRLIARTVVNGPEDEGFSSRTFYYGIYNQLADDFTDMFDDMNSGAVTPYTYFIKYHHQRRDLINPFELYWAVISHLIHNVYHSETKTCEVILDRAINGLKRFKEKMGIKKYNEVMEIFGTGNPRFIRLMQKMIQKADNVDFFDKLLRDHIIAILKDERLEQEKFLETIQNVRQQINNTLFISKTEQAPIMKDPIIDAANYSLEGDGKRLRPIITWVMGVNEYKLNPLYIAPLLRSLEYIHTASLIFDDLPSQDNAPTRRGRQTLHQLYNIATAELTGLFLTQKAVVEQASLNQFDSKTVLRLIQYSAQTVETMCRGQAMDLESKGKHLNLEQLNLICFYKTGIAFEASLVMPAILAHAGEPEMTALKKFAYHCGIAFQIKDDLLDIEGDPVQMGKSIHKDAENNNSTFVTILGNDGAGKAMWDHYCLAFESLQAVPRNTVFLKQLLKYIVNREY